MWMTAQDVEHVAAARRKFAEASKKQEETRNVTGVQRLEEELWQEAGGARHFGGIGAGEGLWAAWTERKRQDDLDEDGGRSREGLAGDHSVPGP